MGLTDPAYKQPKVVNIETSWDDGSAYDLRIANLLTKYNLKGTFYIVADWVGKRGYLTWEDIKKLDKDGFTIGSHTMTHPQDLKNLYDDELFYEIQTSKDIIETVLGHNINSFCYPRGRTNKKVIDQVIEAGYYEARGTGKPGVIRYMDKYYLPGTIHIFQRPEYKDKLILDFAKETIDRVKKDGGYCNIWGHSREVEKFSLWDILEQVLAYASKVIS